MRKSEFITSQITIHIAFVLTGATNTLLGPLLPVLVGWWGLADPDAGFLFTLQFAGSIVGAALASPCIERFGLRSTLISGIVLTATGVGALGAGTPSIGYPAVSWFGLGLGLTIPATNLLVAETASSNRAGCKRSTWMWIAPARYTPASRSAMSPTASW